MPRGRPIEGLLEPFVYGRGFVDTLPGDDPAAGAGFVFTEEGRWYSRARTIVATLVTDANAADRYVSLVLATANGDAYSINAAGVTVPATTTVRFVWQDNRGQGEWATGTDVLVPLQRYFLRPADTLTIAVDGIQAGDQLSGILLTLERLSTGPRGYPEGDVDRARGRRAGLPALGEENQPGLDQSPYVFGL